MKRFLLAYILLTVLLIILCTGCSTHGPSMLARAYVHDPRCQPNQWCPYTDPPSPIRTEVLRSGSAYKDPAVR